MRLCTRSFEPFDAMLNVLLGWYLNQLFVKFSCMYMYDQSAQTCCPRTRTLSHTQSHIHCMSFSTSRCVRNVPERLFFILAYTWMPLSVYQKTSTSFLIFTHLCVKNTLCFLFKFEHAEIFAETIQYGSLMMPPGGISEGRTAAFLMPTSPRDLPSVLFSCPPSDASCDSLRSPPCERCHGHSGQNNSSKSNKCAHNGAHIQP